MTGQEGKANLKKNSGISYWRTKFSEMAENSKSKVIEVRGAKEHILRMEKGIGDARTDLKERTPANAQEQEGSPPTDESQRR